MHFSYKIESYNPHRWRNWVRTLHTVYRETDRQTDTPVDDSEAV